MTKDVAIAVWLIIFFVAWAAYSVGWRVGNKAELEAENAKLKRMYADLALMNEALKDVIEKKL